MCEMSFDQIGVTLARDHKVQIYAEHYGPRQGELLCS